MQGQLLIQYDWYPYKKTVMRHTQAECHVMMKAALRAMQLQDKEHQKFPANYEKLGRNKEGLTPLQA